MHYRVPGKLSGVVEESLGTSILPRPRFAHWLQGLKKVFLRQLTLTGGGQGLAQV
jgi:hypothetical protein